MSLNLGFRRVVVISSVDVVRQIMKSHDVVCSSRPVLVNLHRLSFNGQDISFSPYNEKWREMKKISTIHLFSTKKVESFLPIFKDEVSKMIGKIAMDASSSTITDLSETMMLFSGNAICRVAFGKSYGGEGYGKNRFFDIVLETQHLLGEFFMEDYLPSFRWFDSFSGMTARLEKNFWDLNSFYEELIEDHMNPNKPKSMEADGLILCLRSKEMDHLHFILQWTTSKHYLRLNFEDYDINAWAIARDPAMWENADEVLPERFLETVLDLRGLHPEVIPFGFGRGRCLAVELRMCVIELALANVLYKFDCSLPNGIKEEDIDFDSTSEMAMHKKNALRLVAKVVQLA